MLGRDLDDAQQWVDSWSEQISARARAAAELADRVSGIRATAASVDGSVKATVSASGVLTDLDLDDRVQRLAGADLARLILTTIGRAQAQLTGQVADVVRDTVGSDSETGRATVDSYAQRFPALEDDTADPGPAGRPTGDGGRVG